MTAAMDLLDSSVVLTSGSRASLDEQAAQGPRYDVLHGPPFAEATPREKPAVLESLRWAPFSLYVQLASFEGTQPHLQTLFSERHERLKTDLARYPLSDSALVELLTAIHKQHAVILVAEGAEAERLREVLRQTRSGRGLPPGLFPQGKYLLLGYQPWDGLPFQLAVERLQLPEYDSSWPVALAVVQSAHGKPWDDPKSRFGAFPPEYRDALWSRARKDAGSAYQGRVLMRQRLAEAFLEVVAELAHKPIKKGRPTGWGSWLPEKEWLRVRLQSVVRHRVQARVRDQFVTRELTCGDVEPAKAGARANDRHGSSKEELDLTAVRVGPRRQYTRRGSRTYREMLSRLSGLSPQQARRLLLEMRRRLNPLDYSLFEAWASKEKVALWARQHDMTSDAARQRLRRNVRPVLSEVLNCLPEA